MITQNSAGCRPSDKAGWGWGGSSRPLEKGEAWSPKNFFWALRASVWSKNKGVTQAPRTPHVKCYSKQCIER